MQRIIQLTGLALAACLALAALGGCGKPKEPTVISGIVIEDASAPGGAAFNLAREDVLPLLAEAGIPETMLPSGEWTTSKQDGVTAHMSDWLVLSESPNGYIYSISTSFHLQSMPTEMLAMFPPLVYSILRPGDEGFWAAILTAFGETDVMMGERGAIYENYQFFTYLLENTYMVTTCAAVTADKRDELVAAGRAMVLTDAYIEASFGAGTAEPEPEAAPEPEPEPEIPRIGYALYAMPSVIDVPPRLTLYEDSRFSLCFLEGQATIYGYWYADDEYVYLEPTGDPDEVMEAYAIQVPIVFWWREDGSLEYSGELNSPTVRELWYGYEPGESGTVPENDPDYQTTLGYT